jgi:hypothetical protein
MLTIAICSQHSFDISRKDLSLFSLAVGEQGLTNATRSNLRERESREKNA